MLQRSKKILCLLLALVLILGLVPMSATATADVPIEAADAPRVVRTVTVGAQNGTMTVGVHGTVTFPVTTTNIPDGTYTVFVGNRPGGVEIDGPVTITNGSGTLTLVGDNMGGNPSLTRNMLSLNLDFDGTRVYANVFELSVEGGLLPQAEPIVVTIEDVEIPIGATTVTLPVSIENPGGATAMSLMLVYDASALTYEGIHFTQGLLPFSNASPAPGMRLISWALGTSPVTFGGVFFELEFSVLATEQLTPPATIGIMQGGQSLSMNALQHVTVIGDTAVVTRETSTSFTVSFNANGGTGTMDDVEGLEYRAVFTAPASTLEGETFGHIQIGWRLDCPVHGAFVELEGTFIVRVDATLYAVWLQLF